MLASADKILPKPQVERQKRYQKAASSQVTWFPKTAWLTILSSCHLAVFQ
jgi:hypothetical protein